MIKYGQVTAYDSQTGTATITYVRPDACAKCGGCTAMNQTGSIDLKAECSVGDWVKVSLPDGRFMHATLLAYVLPLVCLLAGLALGYGLSAHSELWALAGSALGLGLSLAALYLNEKRIAGKPEWTPRVTDVYSEKPEMDEMGCSSI